VPIGNHYPPLNLTPQKRKEKTLGALLASSRDWRRAAVLMVFEDVHWIDPLARPVGPHRRTGGHPPGPADHHFPARVRAAWMGLARTLISLSRCRVTTRRDDHAGDRGKALPQEIAEQIIDRTDGVRYSSRN